MKKLGLSLLLILVVAGLTACAWRPAGEQPQQTTPAESNTGRQEEQTPGDSSSQQTAGQETAPNTIAASGKL